MYIQSVRRSTFTQFVRVTKYGFACVLVLVDVGGPTSFEILRQLIDSRQWRHFAYCESNSTTFRHFRAYSGEVASFVDRIKRPYGRRHGTSGMYNDGELEFNLEASTRRRWFLLRNSVPDDVWQNDASVGSSFHHSFIREIDREFNLSSSFQFKRVQFPFRFAFAITIDESQRRYLFIRCIQIFLYTSFHL